MAKIDKWIQVNYPLMPEDKIPKEKRVVLVWLQGKYLPFCGYIRKYSKKKQGDSPFFVVYHGNSDIGTEVIAWCNCLPEYDPMEQSY